MTLSCSYRPQSARHLLGRPKTGFTLVEVAIVLIIVGLLVTVTLKGLALVEGGKAVSTVAQIRAIEVGTEAFKDAYAAFPGDIKNADTKLPACTASPCAVTDTATLGDGQIEETAGDPLVLGQENVAFFVQMNQAGVIDGVSGQDVLALGAAVLPTKIALGSYYRIGYVSEPRNVPGTRLGGGVNLRPGHWIAVLGGGIGFTQDLGGPGVTYAQAIGVVEGNSFTPTLAQRMDTKYDDGNPNNGFMVAINVGADAGTNLRCADNGAKGDYNTQNTENDCAVYVRFSE